MSSCTHTCVSSLCLHFLRCGMHACPQFEEGKNVFQWQHDYDAMHERTVWGLLTGPHTLTHTWCALLFVIYCKTTSLFALSWKPNAKYCKSPGWIFVTIFAACSTSGNTPLPNSGRFATIVPFLTPTTLHFHVQCTQWKAHEQRSISDSCQIKRRVPYFVRHLGHVCLRSEDIWDE